MMQRTSALGMVFVLGMLLLSACGSSSGAAPAAAGQPVPVAGAGTYQNVTAAELETMLKNKDFLFVNVHVPYEGEIDKTDQFIAWEASGVQRVSEYPADKAAKIVLYCRSGRMSGSVAEALVKAGYTNIWNLNGGLVAWEAAGRPVLRKQ